MSRSFSSIARSSLHLPTNQTNQSEANRLASPRSMSLPKALQLPLQEAPVRCRADFLSCCSAKSQVLVVFTSHVFHTTWTFARLNAPDWSSGFFLLFCGFVFFWCFSFTEPLFLGHAPCDVTGQRRLRQASEQVHPH